MQNTELFLSLAEIAGVFVGFGALIAIRGGGATEDFDVASVGTVVCQAEWNSPGQPGSSSLVASFFQPMCLRSQPTEAR